MDYCISGVRVKFPCKAYATQVAMMEKIIKSIERNENCIIETPTGCGKSLSLLCSSLAWQTSKKENLPDMQEINDNDCICPCHDENSRLNTLESLNKTQVPVGGDDEDDDFREPMKCSKREDLEKQAEDLFLEDNWLDEPYCDDCYCRDKELMKPQKKSSAAKIYFSSRTHKQLGQVVKELGRTAYKKVKMTILSSRDHTCIHPSVKESFNKGEKCKELLEHQACQYFDKSKLFTHQRLKSYGLKDAWDIEDIVEYGHRIKGCPYFGARELKEKAEIIFCPYNYLIDPIIRKAMEISLKGNIVILDEAHNIEDVARDAVSYTVTTKLLEDAVLNFRVIKKSIREKKLHEDKEIEYGKLETMCQNLLSMIENYSSSLGMAGGFDTSSKVWLGQEIVAQLELHGLSEPQLKSYESVFKKLLNFESDEKEKQKKKKENEVNEVKINREFRNKSQKKITKKMEHMMISSTTNMLESIFMVTFFMFKDDRKYLNDYRIVLTREYIEQYFAERSLAEDLNSSQNDVWLSKKGRSKPKSVWAYKLHFWCMNSSVAFLDMSEGTRSIILTSGTLSPLLSFQTELGLTFHTTLETNHVIDLNQVSVQVISKGPKKMDLIGNYQNSVTWDYQDEVGQILSRICQTVPCGVLCFLSSYKTLDKLCTRWEITGLMKKLKELKDVYLEPKMTDKDRFNNVMESYYKSVNKAASNGPEGVSGALFLAVCRGKVSEGMDFANNYARAVVLIGIPYPNIKDIQVNLKKSYNDMKVKSGLLSGKDWYEVQAFRALNQALGRCIRHKDDWGAILLIDQRFAKNSKKNISYFSKWVRQRMQFNQDFENIITDLQAFIVKQIKCFDSR